MNHNDIRANYFRTWFPVDLISSIPVEIIGILFGGLIELEVLKVIRIFKITRIFKLLNLKMVDDLEQYLTSGVFRLAKLLAIFVFVAHVEACGLWALLQSNANDKKIARQFCLEDPTTSGPSCYNNIFYTILLVKIGNKCDYQQEMSYGSRIYVTLVTLFGVLLFATIIGGASDTLRNLNTMATAKERQINVMRDYM